MKASEISLDFLKVRYQRKCIQIYTRTVTKSIQTTYNKDLTKELYRRTEENRTEECTQVVCLTTENIKVKQRHLYNVYGYEESDP